MKRTLLILLAMVLLSLSFTTFALAASKTVPPASVCMTDGQYIYAFVTKLMGTASLSKVPVKFYSINGEFYLSTASCPFTGTGHVKGTEFHFSFTGSTYWEGYLYTAFGEGFWDLADTTNPVGTVTWRQITNGGLNAIENYSLSLTSCSTVVLPY